jgi:hypothetical protein
VVTAPDTYPVRESEACAPLADLRTRWRAPDLCAALPRSGAVFDLQSFAALARHDYGVAGDAAAEGAVPYLAECG